MRISDWSSDVCSSDLLHAHPARGHPLQHAMANLEPSMRGRRIDLDRFIGEAPPAAGRQSVVARGLRAEHASSEERPVWLEWVSTCRSRWSPPMKQTKTILRPFTCTSIKQKSAD